MIATDLLTGEKPCFCLLLLKNVLLAVSFEGCYTNLLLCYLTNWLVYLVPRQFLKVNLVWKTLPIWCSSLCLLCFFRSLTCMKSLGAMYPPRPTLGNSIFLYVAFYVVFTPLGLKKVSSPSKLLKNLGLLLMEALCAAVSSVFRKSFWLAFIFSQKYSNKLKLMWFNKIKCGHK